MQIITEIKNNITFIKPSGNMLSEMDLQEAIKVVSLLMEQGNKSYVFDLSEVQYFNSNGLNWLVATLTKSRRMDGDTILMNIPEQLEKLLLITKLHFIFHTVNDAESAENYFNKL